MMLNWGILSIQKALCSKRTQFKDKQSFPMTLYMCWVIAKRQAGLQPDERKEEVPRRAQMPRLRRGGQLAIKYNGSSTHAGLYWGHGCSCISQIFHLLFFLQPTFVLFSVAAKPFPRPQSVQEELQISSSRRMVLFASRSNFVTWVVAWAERILLVVHFVDRRARQCWIWLCTLTAIR